MTPQETEELRLRLRHAVLEDTFLFNKVVMGFADIDIDPHYGLCEFLDRTEWLRRLLLAPRGSIKSWNARGWMIQQVCRNPNIRILYTMSSEEVAKSASRFVDQTFRRNAMLRWLFPDVIPDFKSAEWGVLHRTVNRTKDMGESTFTFGGIGTGYVGLHFDIIILDDVIEEEAAQSETVMKAAIEWFSNCEPLLDEINPKAQILVVGTRWHLRDLYSMIMGDKKQNTMEPVFRAEGNASYMCMKRSAMEDGKPFWPRMFSEKKLAIKKAALEAQGMLSRYYLWYQNNPIAEENCEFPRELIRYWQWSPSGGRIKLIRPPEQALEIDPRSLRFTMCVDPAFEIGRRFDESAISIIGSHPKGHRILFYAWTGQLKIVALRDKIVELIVRYSEAGIPIAEMAIERVGGQRILIPYVREELTRKGVHCRINEEVKRSPHVAKDNHIRSFIPVVAGGWYYTSQQFLGPNQEMETFPNGKKNFLDTLVYQTQIWSKADLEDEYEWYDHVDGEDEDDEREYGGEIREGYGG